MAKFLDHFQVDRLSGGVSKASTVKLKYDYIYMHVFTIYGI